jgi:hypothetical protein
MPIIFIDLVEASGIAQKVAVQIFENWQNPISHVCGMFGPGYSFWSGSTYFYQHSVIHSAV